MYTFNRIEKTYEFHCDFTGCLHSDEYGGTFIEALNDAKGEGWISFKKGTEWKHLCPAHAEMIS